MFFRKKPGPAPDHLTPEQKEIYAELVEKYRLKKKETTRANVIGTTALTSIVTGIGVGLDLMATGGLGTATLMFFGSVFPWCCAESIAQHNMTDACHGTGLDFQAVKIDETRRAVLAQQMARQVAEGPPRIPAMLKLSGSFNDDKGHDASLPQARSKKPKVKP